MTLIINTHIISYLIFSNTDGCQKKPLPSIEYQISDTRTCSNDQMSRSSLQDANKVDKGPQQTTVSRGNQGDNPADYSGS